nr:MAG TPA: hypothetical protein [Crassvirales sp.]
MKILIFYFFLFFFWNIFFYFWKDMGDLITTNPSPPSAGWVIPRPK